MDLGVDKLMALDQKVHNEEVVNEEAEVAGAKGGEDEMVE